MAYFLKKAILKGRTYLSICESFYSSEKKGTAHRTYKSLKSVETLKESGIEDPIAFFQKEVDRMNKERNASKEPKICDVTPVLYMGCFPLNAIMTKLNTKPVIDLFSAACGMNVDLYSVLSSLVYARAVKPCSKRRTFHEVLPNLYSMSECSYDQLLDVLVYLGNNYEKFVEIFNERIKKVYGRNTEKTYFDTTNFYFEIDREDDFRRKGPSKENRHDPLVGLGLLLDRDLIPLGLSLFPGNESEKPELRKIVTQLKKRNSIEGRTIHVADKGLNCAENIVSATLNGDGYLFSKSLKMSSTVERDWATNESGWKVVKDKAGNTLYYYKSCTGEFPYNVIRDGKTKTVEMPEKRVVTYNPTLARKQKFEIEKMVTKAKNLSLSKAKKEEYGDSSKYVKFEGKDGSKAKAILNQEAIDKDKQTAGFNMLVTSEIKMSEEEIYKTYHQLWRIEESFRYMKSDLDARPVFLQKEESIKGHFLVCYLTVLLERLFQFKELKDRFATSEINDFIKEFIVVKSDHCYINTMADSELAKHLETETGLPIRNVHLSETKLRTIMNYRF